MSITPHSNVLLPLDYSTEAQGGPIFLTGIVYFPDGHEQRNVNAWDPTYRWRINYSGRTPAEVNALRAFFNARRGRAQSFLFVRPGDAAVAVDDSSPYVQSSDPGAVGVGRWWVDTSGSLPYPLHVRNAGNSAWVSQGNVVRRARFDQDLFQAKYDVSADSQTLAIVEILNPLGDLPEEFPEIVEDVFPGEYQVEAMGGADWQTTLIRTPQGVETRLDERTSQRRRYGLAFEVLPLTEFNDLHQFFLDRKGRAQAFAFNPPEGGDPVTVRFSQDDLTFTVDTSVHAIGSVELVEVL